MTLEEMNVLLEKAKALLPAKLVQEMDRKENPISLFEASNAFTFEHFDPDIQYLLLTNALSAATAVKSQMIRRVSVLDKQLSRVADILYSIQLQVKEK